MVESLADSIALLRCLSEVCTPPGYVHHLGMCTTRVTAGLCTTRVTAGLCTPWYMLVYAPPVVYAGLCTTWYMLLLYTTLVYAPPIHPGYTLHIPHPARQRVYIPVPGPAVRDKALGSCLRLIRGLRRIEPSWLLKM